jgi:two-component system sensor histidine kinase CreC
MHLGLRLLFGFFVIAGIAAFFVMRVFVAEVKPSVREVMEDILVDSANLLAEQAAPDLAALAARRASEPGATLEGTRFAQAVQDYLARPVDAQIWGLHKRTLDLRVYVTDQAGRVLFDSGRQAPPGADYSGWRDVARTLRGDYGARSTRAEADDPRSSVMYVAAPVKSPQGLTIGVLTVAKPLWTVQQFIDRAERKILVSGLWLLGLSLAVGVAVTLWTVHAVRRLRRYALASGEGERVAAPQLPGELGELARAMDDMRTRLQGRAQVEQAMRALTHELKSPLTAIGGAAELLAEPLPEADRQRFSQQVGQQVQRLRELVDRLLELSKLESLQGLEHPQPVDLRALVEQQLQAAAPLLAQRALRWQWQPGSLAGADATVPGDAERLGLAVSNLLANAIDFSPEGGLLELDLAPEAARAGQTARQLVFSLRDHGPGVPDYALPQLGQRFFSTPRPRDGAKGSGLGLAIVRQVAALHGGSLRFLPRQPGLCVQLALPQA